MIEQYFRAWTNAVLAARVVNARLPQLFMMMLDPTPARQIEAQRMFAEKQTALLEGLAGAHSVACKSVSDMMFNGHAGGDLATDYINALMEPAERTLKANARRLGR